MYHTSATITHNMTFKLDLTERNDCKGVFGKPEGGMNIALLGGVAHWRQCSFQARLGKAAASAGQPPSELQFQNSCKRIASPFSMHTRALECIQGQSPTFSDNTERDGRLVARSLDE